MRYEWDLDGDFQFEVDRADEPVLITHFTMPEEDKPIRLRVTDTGASTDVESQTIDVGGSAGTAGALARPSARAGRARVTRLPFSAQLRGRPLPGRRGDRRRSARRLSLLGALGQGRLRAGVPDVPGRTTRAERALRRFLTAPWRTRVGFIRDRRTRRLTANALALATPARTGRSAACLRIRLAARPGGLPTGRLTLLGGHGAGASLRTRGSFRVRVEQDGSATIVGELTATSGARRALLPRRCRRLASRDVR